MDVPWGKLQIEVKDIRDVPDVIVFQRELARADGKTKDNFITHTLLHIRIWFCGISATKVHRLSTIAFASCGHFELDVPLPPHSVWDGGFFISLPDIEDINYKIKYFVM